MPKSGMHKHDSNDPRVSKGHTNPSESQTITTGSYKKQETYQERARQHKDPEPRAQMQKNEWNPDTRDKPTIQ